MKIKHIELNDFGKYTGADAQFEFSEGLNLVVGDNEAGKSTVFNSLITLIYGFKPAGGEAHPYMSWQTNQMTLKGRISEGEQTYEVLRKMGARPSGRLINGEKAVNLGNRCVPAAERVSRHVFENLYAIGLKDMVQVEDKSWGEIEDKLLINYGLSYIYTPKESVAALDAQMHKIYRESRRGNYRINELGKEIQGLKAEKTKIEADVKAAAILKEAIEETKRNVQNLNDEKMNLKEKARILDILVPIRELEDKIDGRIKTLEPLSREMDYGENHRERLEEWGQELEELASEKTFLEKKINQSHQGVVSLKGPEIELLNAQNGLREHMNLAGQLKTQELLYRDREKSVEEKRRQLAFEVENCLNTKLNPGMYNGFKGITKGELQVHVDRVLKAKDDLGVTREAIYILSEHSKSRKGLIQGLALLLLGVGGFLTGIYLDINALSYGSVILFSFGLFKLIMQFNIYDTEKDLKNLKTKIEFFENQLKEAEAALRKYLSDIQVADEILSNPGEKLVSDMIRIKEMIFTLGNDSLQLKQREDDITEGKGRIKDFLEALDAESDAHGMENLEQAQTKLDRLIEVDGTNKTIAMEIKGIREKIDYLAIRYEAKKAKFDSLRDDLESVGNGSVTRGLDILETNKALAEEIRFLKTALEELKSQGAYRALVEQEATVIAATQGEMDAARERLDALDEKLAEENIMLAEKSKDLAQVENHGDLDQVVYSIEQLEEEMKEAQLTWDRLLVIKRIIETGDQVFRENHQPDIVKMMGRYFNVITGGRYEKVYMDEAGDGRDLMLKVDGQMVSVDDPLSQGTKDQLYLAFRLALVDYLDRDGDKFPLMLDEVFVNWDMNRLKRGIELIKAVSKERQVILFTCHQWFAELFEAIETCHVIRLQEV